MLFLLVLLVVGVSASRENECLKKSYVKACAMECSAHDEADACIDKCIIRREKDAGCLPVKKAKKAKKAVVSRKKVRVTRRRSRRVVSPCGGLRRRLSRWTNRAAKCGDESTACVDRAYKKIASIKRSLVRAGCVLRRRCNLKRLRARRSRLQVASSKCSDDDALCVRENIRRLTKVNRRIRKCKKKKQANVKIVYVVKKVVKKRVPVRKCKGWVHQSMYRNAVTCDSLNKKFNAWLAFARCRRQRNFELSHRCRSSDTGCLRRSFRMIRKIQRQITDAHNEFGTLVDRCDRCAGIKINFRAWLLRQRAKRHRAHTRACLCGPLDVECLQDNVSRIKTIQTRIEARRKEVLSLHADCVLMKTDVTSSTRDILMLGGSTTTTTTTTTTGAVASSSLSAGASTSAGQTVAPAIVDPLAGNSLVKAQIVYGSKDDVPGPGQVLFVRKN